MENGSNKIYDISMPITMDMPVYKGREEKRPIITVNSDFSTGTVYESSIQMNLHTGTHLDRTLHMMPEGNTIETVKLEELFTECRVLDLTQVVEKITEEDLSGKDIHPGDFVLLKTRNSLEPILEKDFIYLDRNGAEYLAKIKIKGVGIDSLGIERSQPGHETHLALMEAGIHILEGLRLEKVAEGRYQLIAMPLNIIGSEAAPVRAVLIKQ
ncbi:cyclase family protein [Parasporobacterium paucivorans]|uniref:Kynurenine formamidase n=1 Tax=Parasporobacterium paucivorans DSM 15970 TaxID=1122934 RepID=A0A1M6IT86_9FIRM|nr:cyclase family protein [Parasporobacterium paucivorans]SHJ37559.1 Kynurenine formamidase [Parasporobacterium paucivorans DSM 15970]